MKPPHAGDHRVREDLDLRVVGLHVRVVDPARGLDLVLELRQVARELLEVLGRAQVRVVLGDGAQVGERRGRAALGGGSPAAGPWAFIASARASVTFSNVSLLVRRVALDRLDQVRHQVVAALELHVDPRPGLVDAVARPDHRVVDRR